LFDDEKDPFQLRNLAAAPEYAALRRQLDARLQAALRRIGDPFRPAAYYIQQWGLKVAPGDSISYAPGARPQTPQRQ
jgi:predicted ATPase